MDSIASNGGHWQPVKARKPRIYTSGLRIHRMHGMVFVGDHLKGRPEGREGKIKGFSSGARRRLRAALMEMSVPDAWRVGITLTVPWKGTNFEPLMDEFRRCVHRFEDAFRAAYPNSAYIYRVELQRRGAPHLHALAYIARDDEPAVAAGAPVASAAAVGLSTACIGAEIGRIWRQSVHDLHHGSLRAFERRGALVESIPTMGAMMRYVADHTSKSKQAQLGYPGKQWGIVGRDNMVADEGETLPAPVSDRHWFVFLRMLRKVMRYRITTKTHHWKRLPPFGSVLRGSRRTVGDFYLAASEVRRMYDFAATV